jgi:hypothetical protein
MHADANRAADRQSRSVKDGRQHGFGRGSISLPEVELFSDLTVNPIPGTMVAATPSDSL